VRLGKPQVIVYDQAGAKGEAHCRWKKSISSKIGHSLSHPLSSGGVIQRAAVRFHCAGSVIAEVEAIKSDRADAVLHVVGFVSGMLLIIWGWILPPARSPQRPTACMCAGYCAARGAVARRAGLALPALNLIRIRVRKGRRFCLAAAGELHRFAERDRCTSK